MYDKMYKNKKKRDEKRKGGMMYKDGGEVNYKKGDGSAMSAVKAAMEVQKPN